MNPQPNYNVDYFIKKFEAIPDELFCVDSLRRTTKIKSVKKFFGIKIPITEKTKAFCAVGHCLYNEETISFFVSKRDVFGRDQVLKSYPELKALVDLFGLFDEPKVVDNNGTTGKTIIVAINNGCHPDYLQPTPKARILKALYDIKAKQEKESTDNLTPTPVFTPTECKIMTGKQMPIEKIILN